MSETKIQENEDLDDVNEEVESYNEVDKRDIVTLKKEMEKEKKQDHHQVKNRFWQERRMLKDCY
jgi:hypothetical protein